MTRAARTKVESSALVEVTNKGNSNRHSANDKPSIGSKRRLEARDSLEESKRARAEFGQLLMAKDAAYATIKAELDAMKAAMVAKDELSIASIRAAIESERGAIDAQKKVHAAEVAKLQSALTEAHALSAALERDLLELRAVCDKYQLMTGCTVSIRRDGVAAVKLVNASDARTLEFRLRTNVSEVEYAPRLIEMNGAAYPNDLKKPIAVKPDRTPNLLRYLLATLYKPSVANHEGAQSTTE